VKPLREAAGFVIGGAWVIAEDDKFLWLLAWPGSGTFAESDALYYASPGRSALGPDPARLIVSTKVQNHVTKLI